MFHRSILASALLVIAAFAAAARAQQPAPQPPVPPPPPQQSQEELRRLRDEKLARPVFHRIAWQLDYDAARALAAKDGKAVLAYFTRSSAPSKESDAFENAVLADPAFLDLAKDFVPFVHCASQVAGEPRPRLLHELRLAVIPTVAFLDAEGKLLARPPAMTLGALAGTAQKVKALATARAAVAGGDTAGGKALLLAEIDLDLLTAAQIRARMAGIEFADAEKLDVDRRLVDVELQALQLEVATIGREEAGRRVAAMWTAGRRPTERTAFAFWGWLLTHAATARHAALADQAFAELVRREDPQKDPRRNLQAREEWQKLRDQAKGQ